MTRKIKNLIGFIALVLAGSLYFGGETKTGLIIQLCCVGALAWLSLDGPEVKNRKKKSPNEPKS